MKIPFLDDISLPKLLLMVWFVLSTLYVAYGEYSRIRINVVQAAYVRGGNEVIAQIIRQSANCQPVPVTLNEEKASFINTACLQNNTK